MKNKVVHLKSKINKKINSIKKKLYLNEIAQYIDINGYKDFKISDLAKSLETSVGTIYNLFGSKEKMYLDYLILKLENFLLELENNKMENPLDNLKLYLNAKYKIFIQIDKNKNNTITNDPFFFHKLDVINHPVVIKIYHFVSSQFKLIFKDEDIDSMHFTILFKKLSDGYIESYLLKKFDTTNIVNDTINLFFNGIKR